MDEAKVLAAARLVVAEREEMQRLREFEDHVRGLYLEARRQFLAARDATREYELRASTARYDLDQAVGMPAEESPYSERDRDYRHAVAEQDAEAVAAQEPTAP